MIEPISTDRVIIVGAGLGALYAALKLAPRPVLMISPETLGEGASSAWAQGGIAAAMSKKDDPKNHATDTVIAGAGTVDKKVANFVTKDAREFILDLTELGTPFDRDENGKYVMSKEAAHSFARVVRVQGDQAGKAIMESLIDQVSKTPSVQVMEGVLASRLEVENNKIIGVWIESSAKKRSSPVLVKSPAVLLAGGGSGGLYALTTNPLRIRGQVIGMAARAGALISDAEFVQFHPTSIDMGEDPAPLATEALRGEGAILINKNGERFMLDLKNGGHKDAELAPRDIVARAIFAQTQAGMRPMLDTRKALGKEILTNFPSVAESCARGGIDPVKDAIPVAAAAHYHMGGIDSDLDGKTSIENLWVCGEASSTGLHGANRLASNGLLEALVFARTCADGIDEKLGPISNGSIPAVEIEFDTSGKLPDKSAVDLLRKTMTDNVGVVRNETGLKRALKTIDELERQQADCPAFLNMTATATLIAACALLREESRGSHYRDDFPSEKKSLNERSHIKFEQALKVRQSVVEELK